MPRLLSNRKPVARPEDLKDNRWEYLNIQNAQPALGLAPVSNTGFTLQSDDNGKITWTNTLGRLEFEDQTITATVEGQPIEISSLGQNSDIILSPYQVVRIGKDLVVEQNAEINGNLTVTGNPLGTFPIVENTLYVTPDGDDRNDGTALDASRACRTISGAVRSPFYKEGTTIRVSAGTYFEDNPIPLKPYTSVVGNDLRTTFVEPLNKDLDLFHINSGCYIAFMQMRNLRRGSVERYAPGGAGTYTTGAYCVAFPPSLDNPIDVYYSPYVQNCTNQSGPWLKDGTMFVPNQTIQIPLGAGTSTWTANQSQIVVTLYTGTVAVGMAINDAANEGYRNAQLLLQRNKTFLQNQVVGYVNSSYPDLEYDQALCYRDVGLIVDAVAGDARFGGNKRSIEAGLAYWKGTISLIPLEQTETVNAINFLKTLAADIVTNTPITTLYNTSTSQVIDLNLDNGGVVTTRINESLTLIANIVQQGESAVPETRNDLLGLIYPTGLSPNQVNVASTVTSIVSLGNNEYQITLSTSTVSASDNATIYFGYTTTYPYLDADVPTEWTADDGDKYTDRRLDPTGSGGGALVDGNAPSERSPIQSFVFDAFTQLNQGGNGIHIINNGYAQLVSVFTIFCSNAVIVENGGIASITNSNSNFGDTCLTAKGLGKLASQGFVRNPAYPTNVPNGEYYPLGYWPKQQQMEVFIPSDRDRPHIGQVMEVVAPDTYIDFSGNRVPYINEAGYPGYLIATSNTGTITTGSYKISGIDVSNIAVGHTLYVRDVFGSEVHPDSGLPYVTTGTQVVDVQFQTVILDRPILNGYADTTGNTNYFNLYFCGNAYYTVLSSVIDETLSSTTTNLVTLVPGQETTTSLAVSYAKDLALRVIQNVSITGNEYNKDKCSRDTGIIVDTIVSDLLFSGENGPYTQANFSGLQYWNQDGYTGEIERELTTTTNAIKYVKELARNVVLGITTSTPYQSTVTQVVTSATATVIEADAVEEDFQLIVDILTNGTAGVTDLVVANGIEVVSTNTQIAFDLLQANKTFLQAEGIAYVEANKGFVYDQDKCFRDSGFIVDALALDLKYSTDSNSQSTFAGLQYWNQDGYTGDIAGELTTTTSAIIFVNSLTQEIIQGVTDGLRYQSTITQTTSTNLGSTVEAGIIDNLFSTIVNILNLGTAGVSDIIVSNNITSSTTATVVNAYDLLIANKEYIQAEAVAFVEATKDIDFDYDQTLCARDVGYMIDSVAFDLLHSGNKQSVQSGVYYYAFDGSDSAIPTEIPQTVDAFNFIKEISQNIIRNIVVTPYQTEFTQNVSLPAAGATEVNFIATYISTITNIINNGPDEVLVREPISLEETSANRSKAAKILEANKEFIQAETVAYINQKYVFEYDQTKCSRDIGYMVDSVAHDILYGGNRQAIQSGVFYYGFSETASAIPGEQIQTTAAYNRLKEIIPSIITNTPVTKTINNTATQVISTLTSSTSVVAGVTNNIIKLMTDIITGGPDAAIEGLPIGQTKSSDADTIAAAELLLSNRDFIKSEIIAWVDKYYGTGFVYDQAKCYRDTGLIVDAIATDLLYPTADKSQSNFAGLQYWNQAGYVDDIARELTTTTNAVRYIRDLAAQVVQGITTGTRYQSTVTQTTSSNIGSINESTIVYNDFNTIIDILVDGTAGVTDKIVPNGPQTTDLSKVYAYNLLLGNKNYIQHETIAYIEDTKFKYDQSKCHRDAGLIVDAIALDLLYPTPTFSQSTFAGLQYWDQGSYTGDIAGELTTTTNAIEFVKELAQQIVQNITTGTRYQSAITQTTGTAATSAEATTIGTDFDVIIDILTNGTAGVTDIIVANNVAESTVTNIVNAYNLLIANKSYIQAEAIGYVESTKTPEFEYDQTLCSRDVGYMIDSIAFDLLHGGNRQAVQSGVYYYTFNGNSTAIPNEIPQTISAFNFIKELAQRVILNETGDNFQSTVTQVTSLTASTTFEGEILAAAVNTITNIIVDGPSVAAIKSPISLTKSNNPDKLRAALILEANRAFIQAETVAFVEETQKFEYDQSLCFRDVGYMIDSVAFDLLHPLTSNRPSNRQAVQSGVYYYGFSSSRSAIGNEIPQTTAAYNYIRSLVPYVITGELTTPYQTFVTQTTSTNVGTVDEVDAVQENIDLIVDIINGGPGAANAKVPVSLTKDTDLDVWNAYQLLMSNRQFIQEETIAYINANFRRGSYQSVKSQVFDAELTGGDRALSSLEEKFDIISTIIRDGADASPTIRKPRQYLDSDQSVLNAKRLLEKNRNFIQEEVVAYVDNLWPSKFSYDPVKCSRDTGLIVDALSQDMMFGGNSQSTFAGIQYWNQGLTVIPGEQTTTTNAVRYLKDFATKIITNDKTGYRFYDGGYTYDKVKCARDTGLIVDAIAQDLLFSGTSQSTFAGIQYWNQTGYTGSIASELTTTTNAIEYVKTLAMEVVTNTTGTRYQSTLTQNVSGAAATAAEVAVIEEDFDLILDILNNGTEGVTDRVEPNGLTASVNGYVLAAYNSLMANKAYIRAEAVAYVESTKAPGFTYDQAKCSRDVGYMVDSVAFDLLYGGNKQAVQSGVYYYSYNEDSTAVPGEIAEVTAAYNFIKEIIPYVVTGQTTSTFQEAVVQVVSTSTATVVEAASLQGYIDLITNIVNNGPDEVTALEKEPIGLTRSSTSTVVNAALLLNANREFIKAETIAYIDNKFNAGFVYDQSKCERDTGLIVDSIAFDLLYEGETQSTFAGLQYWNQDGYTGNIANELTTTSNAIRYVRDAVVAIANTVSSTISTSVQANFDQILYILNTGTNGVTDAVIPNGSIGTDSDVVAVYNAILANKSAIQTSTIDWISDTYPTYTYNTSTCSRDVGYIIDSVAFDLLHGGNRQSIMSGVYYYDFNAESTTIRNEIPQTTAAYNYIRSIVDEIIEGRRILTPYQNSVRQSTDLPGGSSTESTLAKAKIDIITDIINNGPSSYSREPIALTVSTNTNVVEAFDMLMANRDFIVAETIAYLETTFNAVSSQRLSSAVATSSIVNKVQEGFDIIIDILENGTDGVTDLIVPNSLTQSQDSAVRAAYQALQDNKRLIQNEVTTYVDQMNNFVYDRAKCLRDTGLIVDAIALDLKYPTAGDSQSTFAGLQYWNQDGYTGDIANELTTTTNAIVYLSGLAQKVVVNNKTGTRYQNTITQTTSTAVATPSEAASVGTNFGYIVDILTDGPAGITDIIVPNGRPSITTATVNAYNLLLANKEYLQAEVVAWVEANRDGAYDRSKCYRDSGIIVDSVISDILFPTTGNSQSTFSGLQYWNQNGYTGDILSELTTTTNAINYVNRLAQQVVQNITTGTRYQSSVAQTTGTAATAAEAMAVNNEFSIITNILTKGTAGVTDLVIGNGITANTNTNTLRAYSLLQANKAYIQAEAVAYVEATKTTGFSYDQTKCSRDVGYMVDSVCFDMLYGGNRQAVQSGVYYYAFDAGSSAIPNDIEETLLAFAHIKEISQQIVMNSTVTTYQSVVSQVRSTDISNTATVALIGEKFDVITDIIENGPSVAADKEPISLTKETSTAVNRAAALLKANREFIQAETIAFIEATIAFNYDQAKCYRDVGYMIDSVAFDLLHGGNKQSIQSGVYYYGYDATSTAINNEIPQTTAAYNRIREILPQIVQGQTVAVSEGNTVPQITYMLPATSAQAAVLQSKVDRITDIINNGPSAAPSLVPISLTADTSPLVDRAYDLLVANREFIKAEVVAYVNQQFCGFEYDRDLCYRDVGYMIDSVSFDLLYGGNKQAVQSGVYYYGHNGEDTAIPKEIPQTTAAYNFIERIVGDIVTGTLITQPQQRSVAQVTSIGDQFYSVDKCMRDTGILVDSFVTDLLFSENGYTQSNFSGLQYWNQAGYTGDIANELTTTTNAIRYLSELAQEVVVNDFRQPERRWQNTVTQVTAVTTATFDQVNRVAAEFDIIVDILTNGTAGVTDRVEANGIAPISADAQIAYNLLIANKDYFAAEIVAYVELNKSNGYEYDKVKCARDVGYIIDSVAFDLLYGGNRQAIQSGVYYYGFSETGSAIPTDLTETLAAYTRLREILPAIVTNQSITKSPNNTLTQITNLTTSTVGQGARLEGMVDLVTGIITNGPGVALTQEPIGLTASTSTEVAAAIALLAANKEFIKQEVISYVNYTYYVAGEDEAQLVRDDVNWINKIIEFGPDEVTIKEPIGIKESSDRQTRNAAYLLKANRDFIRAETLAFINNTYNTGFLYDKAKCQRDTGLIVDSIAFDLLHNGVTESTFAGLQYWNQDTYVGSVRSEITTTTNAIRYIKEVVGKVVMNDEVVPTTGNTSTQITNLPASTTGIAAVVTGHVQTILDILDRGTAGVTDVIVPNGVVSSSSDINSAYNLLMANKEFIQNEVIARIDYDNTQFEYDRTVCRRDVGYIIDSIAFDLLHGGNRQSITSGVYYYGFNARDTVIDDQVPQTTAAYERIKELIGSIIKGEAVGTYQYKVKQVINNNVATDDEVTALQAKVDIITNIINNGPAEADSQTPINHTASTDANIINAFNLLIANRNFIKAEVTAYIDAKYTDTPNYDRDKCYRDVGAIIDAVNYDLVYGGNYNSVNTGNGYFNRKGQYHIVRLEQNVTDPTLFIDGATVRFYQQSYISASGYLFEYVGAGTQYGALPQVGKADPVQQKEVVQLNNGKVFFTSTDQNGDFRIGPTLVISQSTGVLAGRTFEKSLYATMTPFILVVGA